MGKKEGHWVYWHWNGRKEMEGDYINGKKDGIWTIWDEFGEIIERARYKNGVPSRQKK